MINHLQVSYEALCYKVNQKLIKSNEIMEKQINFLGQEKALQTLDFGLKIHTKGYNIYLSGETGTHKEQYIRQYIGEVANNEPVPNDWCYVYDFQNELKPIAIALPAGMGRQFKEDMNQALNRLISEVNTRLESQEHLEATKKLKQFYYEEGEKLLKYIKDHAKDLGFYTQISDGGLYFVPIVEGKKISEKMYDDLSIEEQEKILAYLNEIEDKSEKVMAQVKDLKKEAEVKVQEFEDQTIMTIIEEEFETLFRTYRSIDKIQTYLMHLKQDLTDQIYELVKKEESKDELKALLNSVIKEDDELPTKYFINLLVDNSKLQGKPVIYCGNPNFNNLVGRIEYENELGNLVTDFTKIQGGLLHRANGGYLILRAHDVLTSPFVWEFLKKAIINGRIEFENIREKLGGVPLKGVDPESIPLDVKVILIGNQQLYQMLYYYDEDFEKIFKVHVALDYEMEHNEKTVAGFNSYIDKYINDNQLLPVTTNAKYKLLKYASRLAGSKKKFSTKMSYIEDVLDEANYWAKETREEEIGEEQLLKALADKEERNSFIKEKIYGMIADQKIKVDVTGEKVGQINGLAVIEYGGSYFGKASRITATTYMGQNGMINIEKEAGLSGAIHNKGVNILSGYLGQKFAQERPLSLNCQLCFEQNYTGIDGDSASSAELYAILSSLADVPIEQNVAVTGSIDQRGNIQAVGGVTEKVEGFYYINKKMETNTPLSVILPLDNVDELVLSDAVLEDIKKGTFRIYAIQHIEEGIEILTGKPFEQIEALIHAKLEKYHMNNQLKHPMA